MKAMPLDTIKAKNELSPLSLESLLNESITDFNLYIEVGGHMVLYAPKPYFWTKEELSRLMRQGHQNLYYDKVDEDQVNVYRRICLWPDIDQNESPIVRVNQIMDLSAQFSKLLFEHGLSESLLHKGQQISEDLLTCIKERPSCIQALEQLKDHHDYTYYHSARVAAYSTAIALTLSISDENDLRQITTGCLLHDIGKAEIPKLILEKPAPLTTPEWDIVKQHPEIGAKQTKGADLGFVPTEIILHHHEREDGRGYPHNLSQNEIITEVKIAAFSDVFDALTSERPYQKTKSRYEALEFINAYLKDHIMLDAYKAMVHLLHGKG